MRLDAVRMIYRPATGTIWDPSVLWHNGQYHMVTMYNPGGNDGQARCASGDCWKKPMARPVIPGWPSGLMATCGLMSVSNNGAQWRDGAEICPEPTRDKNGRFFKAFIGRLGDRFILNHGVVRPGDKQDTLRFYESKDLKTWNHLGDTHPDPRWYETGGRWDHMYMLPKDENDPGAGYWGYPVATAKAGLPRGIGMAQSRDGVTWEVLPPAVVEWGEVPPIDLEIGGVERIGGKYVLIGGNLNYLGDGYSMYTLIADAPTGPFLPDVEAYRLGGTSSRAAGWSVTSLAAWCRGKDGEKLISNYVVALSDTWLLPLRRAVFDDGHLRLGWWSGNEALRGERVALGKTEETIQGGETTVWLAPKFDLCRGGILEGRFTAKATGPEASVGFALAETLGRWKEIQLGLGVRETRIGRRHATTGFAVEDVTGRGCASVAGVNADQEHTFRLLFRHDIFELYVDDLLAQTYLYEADGGRVGFAVNNATVRFFDLSAYVMKT